MSAKGSPRKSDQAKAHPTFPGIPKGLDGGCDEV